MDTHRDVARKGHLHERNSLGLATAAIPTACSGDRGYHVRRFLPHHGRSVFGRRRLLRGQGVHERTVAGARGRGGRTERLSTLRSERFPTNTFNATNYWVDVVFNQTANDPQPPQ